MKTKNENQLLAQALKYLKQGFSIIPVRGKTCLLQSWSEYQTRKPTKEEVENWFFELNPTGIAIVTGKISGIVVLDVEKDADVSGIDIPQTPTVKTGGGGWHYYFKHPGNAEIKNFIRFKPEMDFKADGGYVIAPPSQHKSGTRYEWLSGFNRARLADIPAWLLEDISPKQTQPKDWERILEGVPEGERHTYAVSLVGKLFRHLPMDEWKTVALPLVESWNERNNPPLPEDELMQIVRSLSVKEATAKELREDSKNTANTDITDSENIDLTPIALKDLLSRRLPELQWTIEQLIPEGGLVVLSAPPSHHKTWLALYFAIQVAHGEMVFDRFKTKQGNVLFIEEDTGDRLIAWRVQKLDPSNKNAPIKFLFRKGIKLENQKIVGKLMELIKKENVSFIIFDSLIQLHNQDENVNKDMAAVLAPLRKIADMGVSVLVLHHHRKESGSEDNVVWRDRSQSLRGASAILGMLNSHLVIQRDYNKSTLRQAKLWERPEMNPLEFEVADENEKIVIRCLGEKEPEKDKKTVIRETTLETLKEEHLTRNELVERLKDVAGQSYVAAVIADMKKNREIVVVKKTGKQGRVEVYGLVDDDPDFDDEEEQKDEEEEQDDEEEDEQSFIKL